VAKHKKSSIVGFSFISQEERYLIARKYSPVPKYAKVHPAK